jgi:hypothetical protein
VIGVAVLVRHHAHHFFALHLGAERTADAAVSAGGDHAVLGLTLVDQSLLGQGGGGAGLYTGAAGHAFGVHERHVLARRHRGIEAAILDGQRQGALLLVAGAHAARAYDALAGIEGEVGIALVFFGGEMIFTLVAIAHFAQAHSARHVLQFAVAVGRTSQAIQGVIRDIEFHHAAAYVRQLLVLRGDFHSRCDRRGARGGQALHALDLHQAQTAGAEGLELLGGAELRDLHLAEGCGAHHRRSGGYRHVLAVDIEGHEFGAGSRRGA